MRHTRSSTRPRWWRAIASMSRAMCAIPLAAAMLSCGDEITGPAAPPARRDVTIGASIPPTVLGTGTRPSGYAIDINDSGVPVGRLADYSSPPINVVWLPSGEVRQVLLQSVVGIGNNGYVGGTLSEYYVSAWSYTTGSTSGPSGPAGVMSSVARAMSPSGYTIVGTFYSWHMPGCSAGFSWSVGSFMLYPWIPGDCAPGLTAVNDRGLVVGGRNSRAWIGGRQAGEPQSTAYAVNNLGTVVGEQNRRAVRFEADGRAVGLFPDTVWSSAVAINDKGEIVINTYFPSRAYLLRGTTLIELASLGGCCGASASAVNERSQVSGGADGKPVVWNVGEAIPPIVANAGGPYGGVEGTPVTFAGSATGGLPPFTYAWSFGDGGAATGASATHAYADDGTYPVALTVSDGTRSASAATTATIANAPPSVTIVPSSTIHSGEAAVVRARVDDPGVLDAPWSWSLRAADGGMLAEGALGAVPDSIRAPVVLRRAGTHTLTLGVVDADGGTATATTTITVLRLPVPMSVAPASRHAASRGNGLLTVTLSSTAAVDVASVVPASIRLGDATLARHGNGAPMATLEDVNGDGVPELVLKFRRPDVAMVDVLVLQADLADGRQVEGRWTW